MLDINFIRENKDVVQAGAKKKHIDFNVEDLLLVDNQRREILKSVEEKRAKQNSFNEKMAKATPEERAKLLTDLRVLKENLKSDEEKLKEVMTSWQKLMLQVPNIPDMSVPEGEDDSQNIEYKVVGDKPKFDFKPKSHIELMEMHDMVDFQAGADVAGFRGYFLKGDGAKLSFALWQLVIDHFSKKDFIFMSVPSLVRKKTLLGTGYLPQGEEDLYKIQDGDYLAGTAEVATMSYFSDKIFKKEELPKKILSFSPCFRREAGSYGKDTKGLMRVHEFFKFEQVVLCEASHEESVKYHEEITKNAEELVSALGLPYRIVVNCGGDLGLGQVKKYDIECFNPAEGKYRETHSASYFHDFQTRRLGIKYKDENNKIRYAHSLNNTAFATPRILISIIENYQQADGSIKIPEVLQKYLGASEIKSK